jgi:hypothetical protein
VTLRDGSVKLEGVLPSGLGPEVQVVMAAVADDPDRLIERAGSRWLGSRRESKIAGPLEQSRLFADRLIIEWQFDT